MCTEALTLKQSKVHIHINSLKFFDNLKIEKNSVIFKHLLWRNVNISMVNQDFQESLLLENHSYFQPDMMLYIKMYVYIS